MLVTMPDVLSGDSFAARHGTVLHNILLRARKQSKSDLQLRVALLHKAARIRQQKRRCVVGLQIKQYP